jgi:hypothetical protein
MESTKLTFNEYPFLKELGLQESNLGVYHSGTWSGSGEEAVSLNPANNKPIAKIKMGTKAEYEACGRRFKNKRRFTKRQITNHHKNDGRKEKGRNCN